MRGVLKLSKSSPIPALHFLLGELPAEAVLHIRTLGLLHNIVCNPSCTVNSMVTYILMMCEENSTTWSNHTQLLCKRYDLPSPLSLLNGSVQISKMSWNTLVKTKVTTWHEKRLRESSLRNSKMGYLNVELTGLSGRPHPILQNIFTTQDAMKLRLHTKFLTCDYMTNESLSKTRPNRSSACDLCSTPVDSVEHILVSCRATSEVRQRLYPELLNVVSEVQPLCAILQIQPPTPPSVLVQFILDCTSINLPESFRIPTHNPGISKVCKVSRDWCFAISSERSRLLRQSSSTEI